MLSKRSSKNKSTHRNQAPMVLKAQAKKGTAKVDLGPIILTALMFFGVALTLHIWSRSPRSLEFLGPTSWVSSPLPLEMEGGDPYLRALMRTISASESNTADPYRLLYGGKRVTDLSMHPDECVTIVTGPNKGDCTTAAGRYQFLTTTWYREADNYHPERPKWYEMWEEPSFEPAFQDQVVHDWLADPEAWGTDISQLLREGEINLVLQTLSGTWTSLGYGIEDNSMSALLPQIYDEMLREELAEQG